MDGTTHGICIPCAARMAPDGFEQDEELGVEVDDYDLGPWPEMFLALIVTMLLAMSVFLVWRLTCAQM